MAAESTIRDSLNSGNPNRVADALRSISFGDLLNLLASALTATETGVTVTANVATLANQPTAFVLANATTATSTGIKALKIGQITGPNAVIPNPGEAVWDGNKKVLFNVADAVTAAAFTYATAANVTRSGLSQPIER